jgi:hypothetical protein
MPIVHKYELPPLLQGVMSVSQFDKLLNCKADTLRKRDLKLGRPYAAQFSKAAYKEKIYAAFLTSGPDDPYTGDTLRWDLLGKWNNKKEALLCEELSAREAFGEDFFLLPTVDHIDPGSDKLEFEICSWIVNVSKSIMNREEYLALCRKVIAHSG